MKRKIQVLMLLLLFVLGTAGMALPALAARDSAGSAELTGWKKDGQHRYYYISGSMVTGWKKLDGKVYYFRTKAEKKNPKGSRVTGLYKIGKRTYYFSEEGVLQLGWRTINRKNYYFKPTGKAGIYGSMYTGFKKIGSDHFLFQKNGAATVGWADYKGDRYFFSNSKKLGTRGRALTGNKKVGSVVYYFREDGTLKRDCWLDSKHYLDSDGKILKKAVTPDGYVVNSEGVKARVARGWITVEGKHYYYVDGKKSTGWKTIKGERYYFDEDGVRQNGWLKLEDGKYYLRQSKMMTGWQTIKEKKYYFGTDGHMAVNTTVDGWLINKKGVVTGPDPALQEQPTELPEDTKKQKKILLIAGHGQGDAGATATYGKTTYYEYKYTREFTNLIYQKLKGSELSVTMYDPDYDCYQVVAGRKKGPNPQFTNYDYVLEIHFNATVESAKDLKGDKIYKGVGMYVNSAKKDITLDQKIVQAAAKTGFRVWGAPTGVFRSSGLLNARTCQEKGVPYGLLETAFIDDRDDMRFYNSHKKEMAEGVAGALVEYFSHIK